MDIKIFGLTVERNPKPTKNGNLIVAYFDCQIEWLQIQGAALVRLNNGEMTCWEPLSTDDRKPRRCMKMLSYVRREAAQAALPLFEAMHGNTDEVQVAAE